MTLLDYIRNKTKPKLPEDIKEDLEKAVSCLLDSGVPVKELRLFGSLDNGCWDRKRSDIDLAVFLGTDDKQYSAFNRVVIGYHLEGDEIYGETPERKALRNSVKNNPDLDFAKRYELHIMTPSDLKRILAEDSHYALEMIKGRRINPLCSC